MEHFDVVVVGGGPAGLSAALMLGRCCRRVLLCDAGEPRNAASHASHGVFTRDGAAPAELLRLGREQLAPYGVVVRDVAVARLEPRADEPSRFDVHLADGARAVARKVLLATGLRDELPAIEGLAALYGTSAFHCPYCDGWEVRGAPLLALARPHCAAEFALGLLTWSRDVVLCTHGDPPPPEPDRVRLARHGVGLRTARIARLEGTAGGVLERVIFEDGEVLARRALFFHGDPVQRSTLPARLGCEFTHQGTVKTQALERTGTPGVFVAGDASRDVQWVIVAAAEGAKAAMAINQELRHEDFP